MRILIAFLLGPALLSLWPASGEAAQLPTLPQTFIDTTYSPPSGNTIVVNAGDNLQTAINSAVPGDTIVLQAGATFTGPFTLPNKAGSGWIYIQSSAYASLPPPGTRVSIADSVFMPKIVGTAAEGDAIHTNAQAHNYRFVGIEIGPAVGQYISNLVDIGNGETALASLPHDITFDRCYIHGDPIVGGRRGVAMNGASVAVVDSYVSDFKENGSDTQALWSYNSPGPVKIVNNFLEASGENVMFGGSDPAIANLVPSDIEIRRNHFFKPLSWITENSPNLWTVKNLLEFKNAQRILVAGNLFENVWLAAQSGYLLNVKSVNQDGACTWCVVQDLTFRNNRGKNLENGLTLGGDLSEGWVALAPKRWLIENNELQIANVKGGSGSGVFVAQGTSPRYLTHLTIRHNTVVGVRLAQHWLEWGTVNGIVMTDLELINNLFEGGTIGFRGRDSSEATPALDDRVTNGTVRFNAWQGRSSAGYGAASGSGNTIANNLFPATQAAIQFVNYAGANYRLSASSPLHNAASDGTDVGANISAIDAAISGGLPAPTNLRVQ